MTTTTKNPINLIRTEIKSLDTQTLCKAYEQLNAQPVSNREEAIGKGNVLCAIKVELHSRDDAAWTKWTNSNMPSFPSKFFS